MKLGLWIIRGLGVTCLVLGGFLLSAGVVSLTARDAYAQALSVNTIVIQGNQRVEADTIRSYFRRGPGGRLDAFQIDEGVKALYATGLFQDVRPSIQGGGLIITVVENPVINRIAFEGNKKVKDEQLKVEIQSKERGTLSRPIVQADVARLVGGLPPQRPLRYSHRAEDHRASEQSRRSRLRDQRRRQDRRQAIEFIGNRAYSVISAQGCDQDVRDRLSFVPADRRHLRSRPDRGRPRAAAPLLSQARLHRCAGRLRGRRIRSDPARVPDHLHDRGGRAVSVRHGRRAVERTGPRSGCCGRNCGPIRAMSTTPRRSRKPSRT